MKKRNMKMTSVVLTAALAAVSLAGCGGSGKTETTVVGGSADTTAAENGFEAESSEGEQLSPVRFGSGAAGGADGTAEAGNI